MYKAANKFIKYPVLGQTYPMISLLIDGLQIQHNVSNGNPILEQVNAILDKSVGFNYS
jgi:hypothetical protein